MTEKQTEVDICERVSPTNWRLDRRLDRRLLEAWAEDMDTTISGLLQSCVPNVPKLVKTILLSSTGQSENSKYQDALTETIVVAARPVLQTPAPIKRAQDVFNTDRGVFGRMWISKYMIPGASSYPTAKESLDVRSAVELGIMTLQPSQSNPCPIPEQREVETEWTAYRKGVSHIATLPSISQAALYQEMMKEVSPSGPTILYFHGGAHCLMDPATHRWTTSTLAQHSSGRILSVRYRLSPQNIFPAALLDALVAYLSLLSPPPNSYHSAVPSSQIVLAGDSSGAGLAASLLLLLLTLSKQPLPITFNGEAITIASPPCAGLALTSPWLDVSRCLPSCHSNTRWDIIAPPPFSPFADDELLPERASPDFPADDIWPTSPPRAETYCAAHMVAHPLVSPLAAKAEHWAGAPPVYLCVGWEGMQDEVEVFARKVHMGNQGGNGRVVCDGYEGMPHCFGMFPWNRAGWKAMRNWAGFCRAVVHLDGEKSYIERDEKWREHTETEDGERGIKARLTNPSWNGVATWTSSKTMTVKTVKLEDLGLTSIGSGYIREISLTDEEVDRRLQRAMRWRVKLERKMVEEYKTTRPA